MPAPSKIDARTWFGTAHFTARGFVVQGALEPWGDGYDEAQVLVIDATGPRQWISLGAHEPTAAAVSARTTTIHLVPEGRGDQVPPTGDLCVAICTRERPEHLRGCLQRMGEVVGGYEVLVVDNAPRTDGTATVVEEARANGLKVMRHVEHRPGLARARNAALRAAEAEFVAFTDDDARPDRSWAIELHKGFGKDDDVTVVTGLAPPAQIVTPTQALFEKKLKWSSNLRPEVYSIASRGRYEFPFPYSAGHFGTGANFAIRRKTALEVGGFDEALGVGTRTGGGEDMEMFVRVLRRGHQLVYQPGAIVWHVHPTKDEELRGLLYRYGMGLSAVALREMLEPGRLDVLKGQLRGAVRLGRERTGEVEYGMPRRHLLLEVAGVLWGPVAYVIERVRGPRTR